MDHSSFKSNYLWKRYQETAELWYQCVALAKLYSIEVYNDTLSWFSWSAIEWRKTWSPFDSDWVRVNKWSSLPQKWDIIFFDKTTSNKYWHVAVVEQADITQVTFIEQNWWKWTGTWTGTDAIRINKSDYSKVLWRFTRAKKNNNIKNVVSSSVSLNSFLWDNIDNQELRDLLSKTNTILRTLL